MPSRPTLIPAAATVFLAAFAVTPAFATAPAGTIEMRLQPTPVARPPVAPPSAVASLPAPLRLTSAASPGQQCRQAIRTAERANGIPDQLMAAIGRIESGRREADGSVNPWPWSINAEGVDHIYDSKAEAIAGVMALQAQGVRSIDVGCMQVNIMYHADAFATLDQAFDPGVNAAYAARFLVQLKDQTGTWPTATAWYHSATPSLGADYQRKVMAVWPEEMKQPHADGAAPASAWATTRVAALGAGAAAAGNVVPPRHAELGRLLPMAAGTVGRSLAAYRALPIPTQLPLALPAPARGAPSRDGTHG